MVEGTLDPAKAGSHLLEKEEGLREYRCQNPLCQKLLFKARLKSGHVSIRCKRCKHWNEFYIEEVKDHENGSLHGD